MFRKAFDRVFHPAIERALRSHGVPEDLICAVVKGYKNLTSTFRLDARVVSGKVPISRGVRQGSPLSPFLFVAVLNMVLEELTTKWNKKGWGFKLDLDNLISHLAFADDLILLAEDPATLAPMAMDVAEALARVGLELNLTKCDWTSTVEDGSVFRLFGHVIPYTPSSEGLLYLGSLLTLDGRSRVSLEHRVASGWRAFYDRGEVWRARASVLSKLRSFA